MEDWWIDDSLANDGTDENPSAITMYTLYRHFVMNDPQSPELVASYIANYPNYCRNRNYGSINKE